MSYILFSDSGSNLPQRKLRELDIHIIPFTYEIDGETIVCAESPDGFDGHSFYDRLRNGAQTKTSLLNIEDFLQAFRPWVEEGHDVMYVGLSSGVSGTFQSSFLAAQELMEEFPERRIRVVDSKGAGLGTGILTCKAADYRNEGLSVDEAADRLEQDVMNLCEYFTVDDLMFLKRTGRVSGVTAAVGTMLQIKPLLRGDEEGKIVVCGKIRGRKKAIETLVAKYAEKVVSAETERVAISHGDCLEEAQILAEKIKEVAMPKELILSVHEPQTGTHVGPGMLAVFFFGNGR